MSVLFNEQLKSFAVYLLSTIFHINTRKMFMKAKLLMENLISNFGL